MICTQLQAVGYIFFTSFFTAVYIEEQSCTNKGNSLIFWRFIIKSGFKSRTGFNGACVVAILSIT